MNFLRFLNRGARAARPSVATTVGRGPAIGTDLAAAFRAASNTAASPGIINRSVQRYRNLPRKFRYGIPIAAVGGGYLATRGGESGAMPTYLPTSAGTSTDMSQAALDKYLQSIESIYGAAPTDGQTYEQMAQELTAANQAALDQYLSGAAGASAGLASQVEDRYQNLSKQLLADANAMFNRGQLTGADIDALYANLADVADYNAQADMTTGTATQGLAPAAGSAATGQQTSRAYGRGLADYLGASTAASSAAGERTAAAMGGLGAGIGAGMRGFSGSEAARQRMALQMQANEQLMQARQADIALAEQRRQEELARQAAAAERQLVLDMETAPMRAAEAITAQSYAAQTQALYNDDPAVRDMVNYAAEVNGVPEDQALEFMLPRIIDNPYGWAEALRANLGVNLVLPAEVLGAYQ